MRYILIIIFFISVSAIAAPFDISKFPNANRLIWDDEFVAHANTFFGDVKEEYFWAGATTAQQVLAGFGGPPEDVDKIGENTYFVSACRHQSCGEKSAYVTANSLELYGIISYLCANDAGGTDYCSAGQLVIFYKDERAKDELSTHLIEWKNKHASKAVVVYKKVI